MGGTKPDYYYSNAALKVDDKDHESLLTEAFVLLHAKARAVLRGPRNVDPTRLPDLTFVFTDGSDGEARYDFELDRRTMSLTRMRSRFARYAGSRDTLLVVTTGGPTRMNNLVSVATGLDDIAFFATFEALRADPYGKVWTARDGGTYELAVG